MLDIRYFDGDTRGRLTIDLEQLLPCSKADFRVLLDTIRLSDDIDRNAKAIYEHIADRIGALKKQRTICDPNSQAGKKELTKINAAVKKLLGLSNMLVKSYGFDPLSDIDTDNKTTNENAKEKETMKKNNETNNYFAGVKNLEELRTIYKNLVKANHPDNGGDVAIIQEINVQYDKAFQTLKSGAQLDNEKEKAKWSDVEDAALREALCKVVHLHGLNIEIVGCWIWVDGETYANRDALKEAGYKWSNGRKKWHFAPYESKWHKGSKKSFDQLRREYGSAEVEKEERTAIA